MASKSSSKSDPGGKSSDLMDDDLPPADLKVILLGDSAVGKSKLVERFLMGDYHPRQLSTYGKYFFLSVVVYMFSLYSFQ
jgi:Rab-like protein 2